MFFAIVIMNFGGNLICDWTGMVRKTSGIHEETGKA